MAFADNVLETVAAVDFLSQGFHGGQIPENFDAANDIAGAVLQHGGADTGGYGMAIAVQDIDMQVDGLPAVLHGFAQGAIRLADIRAKYIEAFSAQRLIAGYPGNLFSGMVEIGYIKVKIYGEDTIGDGIQNGLEMPAAGLGLNGGFFVGTHGRLPRELICGDVNR
jgi:hypothetical protein